MCYKLRPFDLPTEVTVHCYQPLTEPYSILQCILVPRAHDPFGLRQGSRPLAGAR